MDENVTMEEYRLIARIAKRARELGVERDVVGLNMDICNAHTSCPLKLEELLEADEANFLHDVCGIVNNLNRVSGVLENCFVPRFAK